jgi:hypothetical protein
MFALHLKSALPAIAFLVLTPLTTAQEAVKSAELKQLSEVIGGSWNTAVTYEPTPASPKGGTGAGSETVRTGPGGQSLIIETSSTSHTGEFRGHGVITWSKPNEGYQLHWFTSASPHASEFIGKWHGQAVLFNGREWIGEQEMASRHSITNIKKNSFDYAIDMGPSADKLRRTATLRFTRASG